MQNTSRKGPGQKNSKAHSRDKAPNALETLQDIFLWYPQSELIKQNNAVHALAAEHPKLSQLDMRKNLDMRRKVFNRLIKAIYQLHQ